MGINEIETALKMVWYLFLIFIMLYIMFSIIVQGIIKSIRNKKNGKILKEATTQLIKALKEQDKE